MCLYYYKYNIKTYFNLYKKYTNPLDTYSNNYIKYIQNKQ